MFLRPPTKFRQSLANFSAIPCEPCSLKNRDFFWYCEIFLPNTWGPLGCLLGFWPSGPKPCGGNYECSQLVSSKFLETARKLCFETFWISSSLLRIQKTLSRFQRMKAEFITTVMGVLSSVKMVAILFYCLPNTETGSTLILNSLPMSVSYL